MTDSPRAHHLPADNSKILYGPIGEKAQAEVVTAQNNAAKVVCTDEID